LKKCDNQLIIHSLIGDYAPSSHRPTNEFVVDATRSAGLPTVSSRPAHVPTTAERRVVCSVTVGRIGKDR